mgnify:CR=1 FL=1
MNSDSWEIAEQSPNVNQVVPCSQLVHVGPNLGEAKQRGQFTPDENLASTSCQHWRSSRELQVESWPLPRVLSLLRRCCLICLQLEQCLFGCPSHGLCSQLVRMQLTSFKCAAFRGSLCGAPVYLIICLGEEEDMSRKQLVPKMEKVAKL